MITRAVLALAIAVLLLTVLVTTTTLIYGRAGPCQGCRKAGDVDEQLVDLGMPAART